MTTKKLMYGVDWFVPIDKDDVSRQEYDTFNHYSFDGYSPTLYPELWLSVLRGIRIYAQPNSIVYASYDGTVKYATNGEVTIQHAIENYKISTCYLYVNPEVTNGQVVTRGERIGTLIDLGVLSFLYVEMYSNYIGKVSPSSKWKLEGAKSLENDKYLLNANDFYGVFISEDIEQPPRITDIDPESSSLAGTTVKISGYNFLDTTKFFFDFDELVVLSRVTNLENEISYVFVTAPPSATAKFVDVKAVNPSSVYDTVEDGFRYRIPPSILTIDPDEGPEQGGLWVDITGEEFTSSSDFTFDTTDATYIKVISSTNASVRIPAHTPGLVNVSVRTSATESYTAYNAFTYIPAPIVSSVVPSSGYTSGAEFAIIYGDFFQPSGMVIFDTSQAYDYDWISVNEIHCTTPCHYPPEYVNVGVRNIDTQIGWLDDAFEYISTSGYPILKAWISGTSGIWFTP